MNYDEESRKQEEILTHPTPALDHQAYTSTKIIYKLLIFSQFI